MRQLFAILFIIFVTSCGNQPYKSTNGYKYKKASQAQTECPTYPYRTIKK